MTPAGNWVSNRKKDPAHAESGCCCFDLQTEKRCFELRFDMDRINGQDNAANSPAQQNAADIVSNMALAHEMLMDDSFKLQSELPENS